MLTIAELSGSVLPFLKRNHRGNDVFLGNQGTYKFRCFVKRSVDMSSTEGSGGWILADGSPWAKLGVGRVQT